MRRKYHRALVAALIVTGCNAGGLTPNQKAEANKEWNHARANVLASLANDQYRDGSLDKCAETLSEAIGLEPGNSKLHLLQARLLIEQGQLDAAISNLDESRKLDPRDAEVEYLAGVIYQRWNQLPKALAAYAQAALKNPTEPSYPLAQAETMVAMNDGAGAVKLLQLNLKTFEHNAAIYDELGQLLVQQKQFTLGIAALREATVLATDDLTLREHLGFALLEAANYSEAGSCFTDLLKDPTFAKRADIHAALASCLLQLNEIQAARRQYDLASELNPTCGGYWLGAARVSLQLQDISGAEFSIRKAIALDSTCSQAHCLLGYLRLKQNRLPESLAEFRTAAELDPQDSVSVCLQGYILARMGRNSDAQPYYARALKMDPNNELASRMSVKN